MRTLAKLLSQPAKTPDPQNLLKYIDRESNPTEAGFQKDLDMLIECDRRIRQRGARYVAIMEQKLAESRLAVQRDEAA